MDYAAILADVVELIADTGRSVTFETLSAVPADATKPWKGAVTPAVLTSLTTPATFVPPAGLGFGKDVITDEMLSRVEQVCLVPPDTVYDMTTCHSVNDGGVRWRVEWKQELRPGATSLLFAMGLSR